MELKPDVVPNNLTGVTTYYLKLFDQYTNRDVWGILDSPPKNNVMTSYLGWKDSSAIDAVNPTLTLADTLADSEDDESEEPTAIEDTENEETETVDETPEVDDMGEEEEEEDDLDDNNENEIGSDLDNDVDVPNQDILAVNFAISETLVFQVKDVQDAIQQIRSTLLSYDLILPPVTIFSESPREIYDIELFDKNFERFWLLHLDIIRVSDTYQVYAGVVAA